jgi:fatty-acyl-CoA synthase
MQLTDTLRYWAERRPDAPALRFHDVTLTWHELAADAARVAHGLTGLGVAAGDRVGILSGNSVEWCTATLGALAAGAMVVPLNVRLAPAELAFIVDHAGCAAVVVDAAHLDALAAVRHELASVAVITVGGELDGAVRWEDLVAGRPVELPDPGATGDDVAFICYTSGTTGRPKGAMLTHANVILASTHRILADAWGYEDRMYLPFPLAFTGGVITCWMAIHVAGGLLVLDDVVDPARILDVIEAHRITILLAVPVIWEAMIRLPRFASADVSSLRLACSGGAPVPEALLRALQAAGIPVAQGYGLTEGTGMSCMLTGAEALSHVGSAGRRFMFTELRVVRDDGTRTDPDEVGEVLIRGVDVMKGYWRDPDATAAAIRDGWLHTGDLGTMDDEGYVRIVDRAKDMLISGGLNVYPAEVERVIAAVPGVAEVAVLGIPDERWGEAPCAVIRRAPGPDGDGCDDTAVLAACRAELADYKVPRLLVWRDAELPRGMSGKVLKRDLAVEYAGLRIAR